MRNRMTIDFEGKRQETYYCVGDHCDEVQIPHITYKTAQDAVNDGWLLTKDKKYAVPKFGYAAVCAHCAGMIAEEESCQR